MSLYTGCLGHWRLNEGTGVTAADVSGNGNNGTLNTASWYNDGVHGWVYHANNTADTGGPTHYINCGNVPFTGTGAYLTFSAWAYRTTAATNAVLFNKGGTVSSDFVTQLQYADDGLRLRISSTGSDDLQNNVYPYSSVGEWRHIIVTFHNGTWSAWRDNLTIAPIDDTYTASTINFTSTGDFAIGAVVGAPMHFVGYMKDVAIWNRELTANERGDVYNGTWPSTTSGALSTEPLYYGATRLDSKTGIQWAVRAGHDNIHGTLIASGTTGTTSASGVFIPNGSPDLGDVNDPVTLELYWEEGSDPVVDRSLIVKTTLVEDV